MRYLYLAKIDGEWSMLTRSGGVILTTQDPRPDAPLIQFHPKTPLEFVDLEWLAKEAIDTDVPE